MGRRISLHIDESLLRDLSHFTKEGKPTKAILKAVDDYISHEREKRVQELRQMAGKIQFDEEWLEQRRKEHPGT